MTLRFVCLASLVSIACGCGASAAPGAATVDRRSEVERYFPLVDGHIFTYQTTNESSAVEMFMVRVKRSSTTTATLVTGASFRSLTVAPDFVRRDGAGFVLRSPLQQGATWQGDKGLVRVVETGANVKVPAGSYSHCVQTEEEVGGDARGKITTFFCPGVGIARMQVEEWHGAEHLTQTMELRSFGPPMDLGK